MPTIDREAVSGTRRLTTRKHVNLAFRTWRVNSGQLEGRSMSVKGALNSKTGALGVCYDSTFVTGYTGI